MDDSERDTTMRMYDEDRQGYYCCTVITTKIVSMDEDMLNSLQDMLIQDIEEGEV